MTTKSEGCPIKLPVSFPLALTAFLTALQGFSAELLKKVADIPLPGGATRFDYASIDAAAGRLYFSHMGDGKLMVFEMKRRQNWRLDKGRQRDAF
jgi:hypothetical protein